MKIHNLFRILMLIAIWGVVMFSTGNIIAEVNEENVETSNETEENPESAEDSNVVELNVETEVELEESETELSESSEQLSEVVKELDGNDLDGITEKAIEDIDAILNELREKFDSFNEIEGVHVVISEPTIIVESSDKTEEQKELKEKIKKLVEDGNLDSDEIAKELKELVDEMKNNKSVILDKDNVRDFQYGPHITTKVLKDPKEIKGIVDEMKKLASDADLDSDELKKKIQDFVKGLKPDPIIIPDKDSVMVFKYDPHITTKTLKDGITYKDLGKKISKLARNEDVEFEALAKKVIDLINGALHDNKTDILRGDVQWIPLEPSKPLIKVNDSNIEKLEKRVEKLEMKIDKLIQKLDKSVSESSEDE